MQIDEDADGFHHRDEFVEGILKNKFPSSRLEMNAVADKFDHGDGAIDWRCVVFDESQLLNVANESMIMYPNLGSSWPP